MLLKYLKDILFLVESNKEKDNTKIPDNQAKKTFLEKQPFLCSKELIRHVHTLTHKPPNALMS